MAITYHAGRRIQGTAADRAEVPAVSGGWKEVGRTTLGSANQFIDVESLPDKRYYMMLLDSHGQSSTDGGGYRRSPVCIGVAFLPTLEPHRTTHRPHSLLAR